MFALGLGLLFAGYTVTLYGYILIKGYNVTVKQMFVGSWPPGAPSGGNGTPAVFVLGGGSGAAPSAPGGATGGGTISA